MSIDFYPNSNYLVTASMNSENDPGIRFRHAIHEDASAGVAAYLEATGLLLRRLDGVATIVQVGVRDLSEEERETIDGSRGRVLTLYDRDWQRAKLARGDLRELVRKHLAHLPREVWISFGPGAPGALNLSATGDLVEAGDDVAVRDLVEKHLAHSAEPPARQISAPPKPRRQLFALLLADHFETGIPG